MIDMCDTIGCQIPTAGFSVSAFSQNINKLWG